MNEFMEITSSRHSRTDTHMNSRTVATHRRSTLVRDRRLRIEMGKKTWGPSPNYETVSNKCHLQRKSKFSTVEGDCI